MTKARDRLDDLRIVNAHYKENYEPSREDIETACAVVSWAASNPVESLDMIPEAATAIGGIINAAEDKEV